MPNTYKGISPYEMLYGMPYSQGMPLNETLIGDYSIQQYIKTIAENIKELREKGILAQTAPLDFTIHKIKTRDKVLIKTWKAESLSPRWGGPYLVLLTTETAVQTAEKGWTHGWRIKGPIHEWKVTSKPGDLRITSQKDRCLN